MTSSIHLQYSIQKVSYQEISTFPCNHVSPACCHVHRHGTLPYCTVFPIVQTTLTPPVYFPSNHMSPVVLVPTVPTHCNIAIAITSTLGHSHGLTWVHVSHAVFMLDEAQPHASNHHYKSSAGPAWRHSSTACTSFPGLGGMQVYWGNGV